MDETADSLFDNLNHGDPNSDPFAPQKYRADINTDCRSQPLRRHDDLGNLAWKLLGTRDAGPDFTAALPLADEITHQYGHELSLNFQLALSLLAHEFADEGPENISSRQTLRRFNSVLRRVLAPYLYGFTASTGFLANLAQKLGVPESPPEVRAASVELVWMKLPGMYAVGDRVRAGSDHALYVVVVPPGADQKTGLTRVQSTEPTMEMGGEAY